MATSGTIGTTVLTVAQMLEHAFRRCGVPPSRVTPEDEQSARESLYMFMVSMAARGINLWCVEKSLQGLTVNQGTYVLPAGTLNVLNWVHSTPSETAGTASIGANAITTNLAAATQICRVGIQFSAAPATSSILTLLGSNDGATWVTLKAYPTATYTANLWYWFDVDPMATYQYFQVTTSVAGTFSKIFCANSVSDLPIKPWNRDDWSVQPLKTRTGHPATNVYFEKLISPQFILWPVPDIDTNHLSLWRHREIQDVGGLADTLEIPMRWYEHIMWQFAFRVAAEVPSASERLPFLTQQADKFQIESEYGETDNAPIYLMPNIAVYTR